MPSFCVSWSESAPSCWKPCWRICCKFCTRRAWFCCGCLDASASFLSRKILIGSMDTEKGARLYVSVGGRKICFCPRWWSCTFDLGLCCSTQKWSSSGPVQCSSWSHRRWNRRSLALRVSPLFSYHRSRFLKWFWRNGSVLLFCFARKSRVLECPCRSHSS